MVETRATESNAISVVIPLYNKEGTIDRTMQSILPQLTRFDEVIVVDDGSTDQGARKVEALIKDLRPIKLFKQKNQGVSVARNRGAAESKHEHIVFLDADDWWLPGFRATIDGLIGQWPEALAWSVGHYRADGSRQVMIDNGLTESRLFSGDEFIRHYGRYSGIINSSSVCVKKEGLTAIGGFPDGQTSGEDIYVWLSLAANGSMACSCQAFVAIDRPLTAVVRCKNRAAIGYHHLFFTEKKRLEALDRPLRSAIKSFLFHNGLRQSAGSIARGQREEAISQAKRIGRVAPQFWLLILPMLLLPSAVYAYAFKKRHKL